MPSLLLLFLLLPSVSVDGRGMNGTLDKSLLHPADATVIIGALFPIHASTSDPTYNHDVCTELQDEYGIQPLQAMMYTLDEINANAELLPGITLGGLALDSCNSPSLALDQSLSFIKGYLAGQNRHHETEFRCGDGTQVTYLGGKFDKVVGVVGGQESDVSVQMASVLRVIKMPQISYLSTSESLSNRERYPYFLRTVPSDSTQAEAILQILSELGWSLASVVYSEGEYGEGGYTQLKEQAPSFNVCLASHHYRLAKDDSDELYQRAVKDLLQRDAKVVVVFAVDGVAHRLMKMAQLHGQYSNVLWIGSDGWTSTSLTGVEAVVEGAVAVRPLVSHIHKFDDYFKSLRPSAHPENPWLAEYCQTDSCHDGYKQLPWLHFVRDAVYAFAHALHDMWTDRCGGVEGLCEAMAHDGHVHGEDLLKYLNNVSFPDLNGRQFKFSPSGAAPPRYSIQNYQRLDDYVYEWMPIGTYSRTSKNESDLDMNITNLMFRGKTALPESSCGRPCLAGEAKIMLRDSCCWRCESCAEYQYFNKTSEVCQDCNTCNAPNEDKTMCVVKQEKFIDYKNRWAITALAFASLGIFSTVLVAIIFWLYLETPVIKAASRELSYILLAGIFLSFTMTFVIVAPPSYFTCGLTRFFLGFSYTLNYAAVLTKTNRISRIFNKNPSKQHKARYTSPGSQVVIVAILVSVEVVINVLWLVYYPSDTKHLCTRDSLYRIRICNGLDDYSYIVGLIYPLVLVCFCTVYAIKTRKCPGGFNEARFIAFTNYTTCLIWLVFVPLYLSTGANDDVRIVTLAMSLSLGGFVQLGCLFFPKVHIVLFKPEKNTRDAVMSTQRSSSYRGGSVRGGSTPDPTSLRPTTPSIIFLNSGQSPVKQEGGGDSLQIPQYPDQKLSPGEVPGLVNQGYFPTIAKNPPV